MSEREAIVELLDKDPFEPFRLLTSGGESFTISNPHAVALLKSDVFIAHPNSDRWTFVPLLHVTAVDKKGNGHPRRRKRR